VEKIKGAKVVSLFFEENKSEDNEFLEVVKTKRGIFNKFFSLAGRLLPKIWLIPLVYGCLLRPSVF